MKILEAQSASLTNYEVLAHIQAIRSTSAQTPAPQKHGNVETILKEVVDYLSPNITPALSSASNPIANGHDGTNGDAGAVTIAPATQSSCPLPPYSAPTYTPAKVRELIQRLQPYMVSAQNEAGLYKNEVLMILNLRPAELMVLDVIVEEMDERFSEVQQTEIVGIARDVLGGAEVVGAEREEDEDDVGESGSGLGDADMQDLNEDEDES